MNRHPKHKIIIRLMAASLSLTAAPTFAQMACSGLLLATDFDRQPTHGSKDALIAAVESGEPIRVGWQIDFDGDAKSDLSHWSEAKFLSVWEGEVFTQVGAIHRQRPRRGQGQIELTEPHMEWRGMIGTTGLIHGTMSDGSGVSDGRAVAVSWCAANARGPQWTLLYRSGLNGEPLAGSKQALLAAVRGGQPIRVGWGLSAQRDEQTISVEHAIAPVFVTIVNGEQVTAQLPEHVAQRGYASPDGAYFKDPAVMWRGLISTQGSFDAVWTNRATGEEVRRSPQRAVFSWFAPAAAALATPTLALPGGVTRDDARKDERKPR